MAVAVAAIGADLAGGTAHPGYAVVSVALVVGAVAVVTTPLAAVGVAAVGWAVLSGFAYGRSGTLVFTASTARVAVILAGAAGFGLLLGAGWRMAQRVRPMFAKAVVPEPRSVEPSHRRVASL